MSYYVVILLTITNIVSLTQHIADNVVYAENKVRYTATLTFVSSALSLLGSIFLAPQYGAVGCAAAFGFAMTVNQVWLNVFYKRNLKIEVGRFFRECHGRILPLIFLVSVVFISIQYVFVLDNWIKLIGYIVVYGIVYIVFLYAFLLNKEEKQLIFSIKTR